MSAEDFKRALYEAVQENREALMATGRTTPHIWHDIKRQLIREYPREFQRVIDDSIEYNNGVYSEDLTDQYIKCIHDEYAENMQQVKIERE